MENYSEFIKQIKPFKFEEYSGISSREKMAVYTIYYLANNDIPTTFDNVCVACYKFFPEEFKLSGDYPEYPDIAGLNRTLMHLRPSERNLATGKPNTSYVLTEQGIALAKQVSDGLEGKAFVSSRSVANHDITKIKLSSKEYRDLVDSAIYKDYLENPNYSESIIWKLFKVIPFTRIDHLLGQCKKIKDYAKSIDDEACLNLISKIETSLKAFSEKKKITEKGIR